MITTIRMKKETAIPELKKRISLEDDAPISFEPRELVSFALPHLHPHFDSFFWDSSVYQRVYPNVLLWKVGEEGYLARYFHLHPFMVFPKSKDAKPVDAIDGTFLNQACPDLNDYYVVEDSDEMCSTELSATGQFGYLPPGRFNTIETACWLKRNAEPQHWHLFSKKLRVHSQPLSEKWTAVEAASDAIFDELRNCLKDPSLFVHFHTIFREAANLLLGRLWNEGMRRLAFFGIGSLTEMMMPSVKAVGFEIAGLFDSNPDKHGKDFLGHEIKNPSEITRTPCDAILITAVVPKFILEIRDFIQTNNPGKNIAVIAASEELCEYL